LLCEEIVFLVTPLLKRRLSPTRGSNDLASPSWTTERAKKTFKLEVAFFETLIGPAALSSILISKLDEARYSRIPSLKRSLSASPPPWNRPWRPVMKKYVSLREEAPFPRLSRPVFTLVIRLHQWRSRFNYAINFGECAPRLTSRGCRIVGLSKITFIGSRTSSAAHLLLSPH
jgi:hypothetical protein